MCGIVGYAGRALAPEAARDLLARQMDSLRHRGPDGEGIEVGPEYGFGHVRLAVIDPKGGAQPMRLPGCDVSVVFNGEIYNYLELREELRARGASFRTSSDTEVLLRAYEAWGRDCVARFNGMFAFALYDGRSRELFLARDPYGQKPLYYAEHQGRLHFASEAGAFGLIPGFAARLRASSVAHFLAFEALYGERSFIEGVSKLPPGHWACYAGGGLRVERYYRNAPRPRITDVREAEELVDEQMRRAVRMVYRADVPVGVLLSGGLDSTLVLAYLRETHPADKVRTFTVANDDPTFDESAHAEWAARLFATEHSSHRLTRAELARTAMELPARLDEPRADPGMLANYFICGRAALSGKVALTGVGGDELFYGYVSFKARRLADWYRHVPSWAHRGLVRPLVEALPARRGYMSFDFKARRFCRGFPSPESLRNFRWTSSFDETELPAVLSRDFRAAADIGPGLDLLREIHDEAACAGGLGRLAYEYQRTYLPEYVLPNADRSSMLHSFELRAPLLDTELAGVVNSMADGVKMPGLTTKALMKKVAERYLPKKLVHRRKVGFTVPVARLLEGELRGDLQEVFSRETVVRQNIFDHEAVQGMIREHYSGAANHYKPLWTLYALQKWLLAKGYS